MFTEKWEAPGTVPLDAHAIRMKVFIDEQGFDKNCEIDDIDITAHHLTIYDDGTPIACGRILYTEEEGTFILGRIATTKETRNTGVGRLIVEAMEKKAIELGAKKTILGAQRRVEKFYAHLGYIPYGENYFEEFCEHVHMYKLH